jgi:predicted phage tail protein
MARTGKSRAEIRDMMDDETWLFGDEIKEAGFVDEIIKSSDADTDKPAALAQAKVKFNEMAAKLSEKHDDLYMQQIAALIKIETSNAHNPAPNAGKNTMEVQKMTLNEFLSQNPAAKNEYDAELSAKFNAGKIEGENAVKARIAKAAPFLMSDCKYPNQIKDLAVGVIKGEKSTEGLETAVAVYDALAEKGNSAAAADESAATAVATGQQPAAEPSKDGVIRNEADLQAAIADAKKSLGMEVK